MEALQHNHLMHPAGMISGDDEMMDSDYDHAVQQDDDYDIEIDGGEVYSNTGDEEMKFDMGEEAITYDNDDLMLDEGEYQSSMIQEEMIITETQPVNAPFSSIEMSTTSTAEIDHTHITQPDTLGDSSANIPDTQPLSQASTQDINADAFILSQHVPGIIVEVPNSPVVAHQVQEVQENPVEIAENTQQKSSGEVEQQDIVHSSNDHQPRDFEPGYRPTEAIQSGHIGNDDDASTEPHANSENAALELEKIHPIIVQFESNTLALFNSEHYLNFSALDNPQSAYPEVPSVFLLQDTSFYTKGFDELFGALREMFGATIGDDAEITMEFEGLELFLHEDNLLSKSISLSDLMDLYIRLSKQDGAERPEPLYAILSTQARFTKRYSELLTAAGEGKGLSQVCTYPVNDLPTTNHLTSSSEEQAHPTHEENNQNDQENLPKSPIEAKETSSDGAKTEERADSQLSGSNEHRPPNDTNEAEEDVTKNQPPVQEEVQEQDQADQATIKEGNGEEEELLPAEDEEEGSVEENPDPSNIPQPNITENAVEETAVEEIPTENANFTNTDAKEEEYVGEYVEEVVAISHERQQLEEFSEAEGEEEGEDGEEKELVEEVAVEIREQVNEEIHQLEAVVGSQSVSHEEGTVKGDDGPASGNSEREKDASDEEALEEEESVEFLAEGDQDPGEQDALVIVDTVYIPRGQSFNAEELLDYEEEEETSPFSEISGEINHTKRETQISRGDDSNEEKHGELPATTSSSLHGAPTAANDDDDSFSSATVGGTREAQSPRSYGTSSHSSVAQIQLGHDVIDTEQHHIEVYQYDEDQQTSADFDNTGAQEGEEVENQESYDIQETFEYNEETWQADDNGEFLQEGSYYTAVVEQEEYANGQYDDQDPSIVLTHNEDTVEGSAGESYEGNEEENQEYPEGEGYGDEEDYEEYPEDPEPEETTEYKVTHGARSPIAKRHREEETDVLDVQDIKRTRST